MEIYSGGNFDNKSDYFYNFIDRNYGCGLATGSCTANGDSFCDRLGASDGTGNGFGTADGEDNGFGSSNNIKT